MPFIVPKKRTSLSRTERFSRYTDIEVASHHLLVLQQRKPSTKKRHLRRPKYRIITNAYPRYEVAYGDIFEKFRSREWHYCTVELPHKIPHELDRQALSQWLVRCVCGLD